jgi:hypothetical protein
MFSGLRNPGSGGRHSSFRQPLDLGCGKVGLAEYPGVTSLES